MENNLNLLREKKGFICDMDGVIYHGNILLPGVKEYFIFSFRYRECSNADIA